MNKVLGFHKKDAEWFVVDENEHMLVPVVSVKWLKKWCKENNIANFDVYLSNTIKNRNLKWDNGQIILVKDLLVAVEKKVKKDA